MTNEISVESRIVLNASRQIYLDKFRQELLNFIDINSWEKNGRLILNLNEISERDLRCLFHIFQKEIDLSDYWNDSLQFAYLNMICNPTDSNKIALSNLIFDSCIEKHKKQIQWMIDDLISEIECERESDPGLVYLDRLYGGI